MNPTRRAILTGAVTLPVAAAVGVPAVVPEVVTQFTVANEFTVFVPHGCNFQFGPGVVVEQRADMPPGHWFVMRVDGGR